MSMSIKFSQVAADFSKADTNNNGKLSKREIARRALELRSSGDTKLASFYATLVVGGKDKKGLFPDFFNADGRPGTDSSITLSEIAHLALADVNQTGGSADLITQADFVARFGANNVSTGGSNIDIDQLKEIADLDSGSKNNSPQLASLLPLLLQLLPFLGGLGGVPQQQMAGGNPFGRPNPFGNPYGASFNNPFAAQQNNPFSLISLLSQLSTSARNNNDDDDDDLTTV